MKGVTTARNKIYSSKAHLRKQKAKMLADLRLAFNYDYTSLYIPLCSLTLSFPPLLPLCCFSLLPTFGSDGVKRCLNSLVDAHHNLRQAVARLHGLRVILVTERRKRK
jgi:hypothetical protein